MTVRPGFVSARRGMARCPRVAVYACCVAFCVPVIAHGEPTGREPSAADRETARALVIDGRKKLAAGDAAEAEREFAAAHAIMNVPTTGLDLAKAMVARGKLVEARDVALQVTRMPVRRGEARAFGNARAAAGELAAELATRIPSLVITVKGPADTRALQVSLDGVPLVSAVLGLPRKVNPGAHTVVARAPGFDVAEAKVEVEGAETREIEVTLQPIKAAAQAVASPAPPPPSSPRDTAGRAPVWPWVVGGTGVAALAVSAGFWIDHAAAQRRVAADCPDSVCDATKYSQEDVQALAARRDRSGVLGIVLTATGVACTGVAVAGLILGKTSRAAATGATDKMRPIRHIELVTTGATIGLRGTL